MPRKPPRINTPEKLAEFATDMVDLVLLGKMTELGSVTDDGLKERTLHVSTGHALHQAQGALYLAGRVATAIGDPAVSVIQYPRAISVMEFVSQNGPFVMERNVIRKTMVTPERLIWMAFQGLIIRRVNEEGKSIIWYGPSATGERLLKTLRQKK